MNRERCTREYSGQPITSGQAPWSAAELSTALQQMDRDGVNQLPVMTDNRVIGMLSNEDVITFLRTMQELGG